MFTGIIQTAGKIASIIQNENEFVVTVEVDTDVATFQSFTLGESIAINGVCLTVTGYKLGFFEVYVSAETMLVTNFCCLEQGMEVNLEKALTLSDSISGHLVSGHVDTVCEVVATQFIQNSLKISLSLPNVVSKYVSKKGSVCLNGVSLTVNEIYNLNSNAGTQEVFSVNIIPHTLLQTTMGTLKIGTQVNLEVDLLARYLERLHSK